MNNILNLPEQDCVGEWCRVFSHLRRPSSECVGRFEPIKVIPLSPEVFPHLIEVSETAEAGGVMVRELLSP